MTSGRALTLALRLLCTTAATAAAVTLPGCCVIGYDPWRPADEVIELETDADLYAVTGRLAVGAGGIVVMWDYDDDPVTDESMTLVDHQQVGDQNLRAVWAGRHLDRATDVT
jgi:hypothetical protein